MRTELLSPAGDMDALRQAVRCGADAVYLGGQCFGARAYASNFSYEQLEQAIEYAHTYGVRVYVTVNTLIYEEETAALLAHVGHVCRLGADALIMQDVGMIAQVRQRYPDIDIHASTQMHNHSNAALEFVCGLGAVRAVLARELSLQQIKNLKCPIEKEVFIHGALCIGSSGQCLFSALTKGRSGNRGQCAQSCRMRYRLLDGDGNTVETQGRYLLSPKDIALLADISALTDAGVGCFKIEGRMKSPEYVGLVTKIYAGLLRDIREGKKPQADPADIEDLKKLFNRGFTKGHLFGEKDESLMSTFRPNHAGVPLGRVISAGRDGIQLSLTAPLRQGDGIKIESSDEGFCCNRIIRCGLLVSGAETGDVVTLDCKAHTSAGDSVVKTSDVELIARLKESEERKVSIFGKLEAQTGKTLRLTLWDAQGRRAEASGETVAAGKTRPVTAGELRENTEKLGGTPYIFENIEVETDGQGFVAKSALNALRRDAVQLLTEARTQKKECRVCSYSPPELKFEALPERPLLHVLVRTIEQFQAVCDIPTGDIYTEDKALYDENKENYPQLRLKTDRLDEAPEPMLGERLLVTDHGGLHVYARVNDVALDYTVGALNASAMAVYLSKGAGRVALSPELNAAQTAVMMDGFRHTFGQPPLVEAVVYARFELMAIRHCLLHHALGDKSCSRCKQERFSLQDEKQRRFPVLVTPRCENRIFENRPSEADVSALLAIGIRHFRVELLDEDGAKSRHIVEQYKKLLEK